MRKWIILLMVLLLFLLTGCKQNPSEETLYQPLLDCFQNGGYACTLTEAKETANVAIHRPESWKILTSGEQEIMVYFDESNRADYLATTIDSDIFGYATHFGLRFVLVYSGSDEAMLAFLKQID